MDLAEQVRVANQTLDGASPEAVARWIDATFGDRCVATVSMQNPVIAHLLTTCAPSVPLVFIDTGYHFQPTLSYLSAIERLLDREILTVSGDVPLNDQWRHDPGGCCQARKVDPLRKLLADRSAWATGVRRADSLGRAAAETVEADQINDVIRVNPIVAMSDDDVSEYIARHALPEHPLKQLGYSSIGCWPCTTPVGLGESSRAGRWRGAGKDECGLHHLYIKHSSNNVEGTE